MESEKSKRMRAHKLVDDVAVEDLDNLLWVLQMYAAPAMNKA